jgi:hypothetical protein
MAVLALVISDLAVATISSHTMSLVLAGDCCSLYVRPMLVATTSCALQLQSGVLCFWGCYCHALSTVLWLCAQLVCACTLLCSCSNGREWALRSQHCYICTQNVTAVACRQEQLLTVSRMLCCCKHHNRLMFALSAAWCCCCYEPSPTLHSVYTV